MDFYDKWPELAQMAPPLEELPVMMDRYAQMSGVRSVAACKDWCVGVLEPDINTTNAHGRVHGGALTTLADTMCGFLMYLNGIAGVTMGAEMHFLRAPEMGAVHCLVRPRKLGRQVSVLEAELKDDAGRAVMDGTITFFTVGGREKIEIGGSV